MTSVFGASGFLGRAFIRDNMHCIPILREQRKPESSDVLYLISTTDNYNVHTEPLLDVQTNLTVLLETLRECEPGSTFNFVSSWFVYGNGPQPATEETPCDPRGFYSITKRAAEQLLISYCETKGIHWRIFRMANLYGPGDAHCSQKKNAMQWLIRRIVRHEDVELYHGGSTLRDYLHVSDAAAAINLCLRSAPLGSITNIGSGTSHALRNVLDYAIRITGSCSRIVPILPTRFHSQVQVRDFLMDTHRLKRLGFSPAITLKEGIKELCSHYANEGQ